MKTSVILLTLLLFPWAALAGDLSTRQAVDKASRAGKFAQIGGTKALTLQEVPLLELVESAESNNALASRLLEKFSRIDLPGISTAYVATLEQEEERVFLAGDKWSLSVSGDGTEVEYQNMAYVDDNPETHALEKIPDPDLVALGRRFIGDHLSELIVTGPGEQIVPWATRFLRYAGARHDGSEYYDQVVANKVTFGRIIHGVPVLGKGSKISVTFANDGTAVAFDFDWPAYEVSSARQRLLTENDALTRIAAFMTSAGKADRIEVPLLECGYWDSGLGYRDPLAPFQAGCSVFSRRSRTEASETGAPESLTWAIHDVIPMGETVEYDAGWPLAEAMALQLLDAKATDPAAVSPLIRQVLGL